MLEGMDISIFHGVVIRHCMLVSIFILPFYGKGNE